MSKNKDYVERSIYKSISLKNNIISLNQETNILDDIYFSKNIITSSKISFDSSQLDYLKDSKENVINNNSAVIYGSNGEIITNNIITSSLTFNNNTIKFPSSKGNIGQFLSINNQGNFVWTEPDKGGLYSLNGLNDVSVNNNQIIFGSKDHIAWVPRLHYKVDLGTTNYTFKDIYTRRIMAYDIDVASFLGRSAIGYCGVHDLATFSHYDNNDPLSFSLAQTSLGKTIINSKINNGIDFRVNNKNIMKINNNGELLVGTNYLQGRISLGNSLLEKDPHYISTFKKKDINYISLSVDSNIYIKDSIYLSVDKRIKKDIVEIEQNKAIESLVNLKTIEYTNIDSNKQEYGILFDKDLDFTKKVINKTKNFIPNIFEIGKFEKFGNNYIIRLNKKSTNDFDMSNKNSLLQLKKSNGTNIIVRILNILDDKRIEIDKDLTNDTDYLYNNQGDIIEDKISTRWNNNIFVYGQEVEDYNYLKESSILTLTVSAIKDLNRALQEMKTEFQDRIKKLETDNQLLTNRLGKFERVFQSRERFVKNKS